MAERWMGVGKRKTAIARIIMTKGNGKIEVNGRELKNYFKKDTSILLLKQPLVLTKNDGLRKSIQ